MKKATQVTIPVVTTNEQANFPFVVQRRNTENWNTSSAAPTLEAAMEDAHTLAAQYPTVPWRIQHHKGGPKPIDTLPLYRRRVGAEKPHRDALWTGYCEPPAVGTRVFLRINGIGPGTVTGYAVEGGYLGVMVKVDEETRPDWHKTSHPTNAPSLAFGPELRALLKDLYALWKRLGDTPVDSEGNLDEPFQHFDKGTSCETVWHWFEEQHPDFIVGEVMSGIRKDETI
jgi:hypothetical protein